MLHHFSISCERLSCVCGCINFYLWLTSVYLFWRKKWRFWQCKYSIVNKRHIVVFLICDLFKFLLTWGFIKEIRLSFFISISLRCCCLFQCEKNISLNHNNNKNNFFHNKNIFCAFLLLNSYARTLAHSRRCYQIRCNRYKVYAIQGLLFINIYGTITNKRGFCL